MFSSKLASVGDAMAEQLVRCILDEAICLLTPGFAGLWLDKHPIQGEKQSTVGFFEASTLFLPKSQVAQA